MDRLKVIIEDILDTGYKVLIELEKDTTDLSKIEQLYTLRAQQIDALEMLSGEGLKPEERTEAQNLFTRLRLLEKKINKNLSLLMEKNIDASKQLGKHQQAKTSYSLSLKGSEDQNNLFIDFKTAG